MTKLTTKYFKEWAERGRRNMICWNNLYISYNGKMLQFPKQFWDGVAYMAKSWSESDINKVNEIDFDELLKAKKEEWLNIYSKTRDNSWYFGRIYLIERIIDTLKEE